MEAAGGDELFEAGGEAAGGVLEGEIEDAALADAAAEHLAAGVDGDGDLVGEEGFADLGAAGQVGEADGEQAVDDELGREEVGVDQLGQGPGGALGGGVGGEKGGELRVEAGEGEVGFPEGGGAAAGVRLKEDGHGFGPGAIDGG